MIAIRSISVGFTTLIWVAILTLGLPATPAYAQESPADRVPRAMKKFIEAKEIPGYVTLVYQQRPIKQSSPAGRTFAASAGLADLEENVPMTSDTLFGIMSMTKPITATALMMLVDEGKISIDDPVEKHIPAFANAKLENGEPVRGLKVRHLLTHTSGLSGKQDCFESLEVTANVLAARPFKFQPGSKWEYGPSMNVVGRIIEVVSGQPYEKFLRERIFEPLAMTDTTFHLTDKLRERMAVLYKLSKNGKFLVRGERWIDTGAPDSVPNPSGGLFSTAGDMQRFYQMILNGGELDGNRIVSEKSVGEMTTVQTGDLTTGFTPGNGWGLGWSIVRRPEGVTGMLSPGTFGHGGAYGTQGWIDPVKGRIFVLLIQRADLGNSDGSDIRKKFQQAAVDGLATESP